MALKRTKKSRSSVAPTARPRNIKMPEVLHEAMQTLRDARYQIEGADVTISRLYVEAVEQYVRAKPQQEILEIWNERYGKTKARTAALISA